MRPDIKCAVCHRILAKHTGDINLTAYVVCAHCLLKIVQLSPEELYKLAYPGGENGSNPIFITL